MAVVGTVSELLSIVVSGESAAREDGVSIEKTRLELFPMDRKFARLVRSTMERDSRGTGTGVPPFVLLELPWNKLPSTVSGEWIGDIPVVSVPMIDEAPARSWLYPQGDG